MNFKRNVILVCGGRDYLDRLNVYRSLDLIHADKPITLLVQGYARGADRLAHHWALARNVPSTGRKYEITSRMWNLQGKRAGWIRNKRMRDEERPDMVVAFPGNTGTQMMLDLAEERGIVTLTVTEEGLFV